MKKLLTSMLCLSMLLTGCQKENQNSNLKHVGVLQITAHNSLDEAYEGFKAGMESEGFIEGSTVMYDFQNALGDKSNMTTIAQKFVAEENNLILAIGTEACQTVAQETSEIPIIGTAITDYVEAGLVDSNEKPGGNISGLSDATPLDQQLDLLLQFAPQAKKIGIIYCSSEPNSVIQVNTMEQEILKRQLTPIIKTVADQTAITDTLEALCNDVDALYIPSDNTLASAMGAVQTITVDHQVPTIVAVEKMCADGGLASIGISYYQLGYETGVMAAKVLKGEAKVSETPIQTATDSTIYYNQKILNKLGLTLPESIKEVAKEVNQ